jgi:DNA-directed RNA polymerase specialized sigma24 family protein
VAALPSKQRHAVAYRYLGGLPYRQIAELLGGTPEAARRAASDGVAALRRTLTAAVAPDRTGARTDFHRTGENR